MAFSPLDLPNLVAWWDPIDASTFAFSSGSVVSTWTGKGGAGLVLSADATTGGPSRSGTMGGNVAIISADQGLHYFGSGIVTGTTLTFGLAYKFDAGNRILSFNNSAQLDHENLGGNLGGPYPQYERNSASTLYGPGDSIGIPIVIVGMQDGTNRRMWQNGTEVPASPVADSATLSIDQINVGINMQHHDTSTTTFGDIVVCSGALSGTDRAQLELFLGVRWTGVTPPPTPSATPPSYPHLVHRRSLGLR